MEKYMDKISLSGKWRGRQDRNRTGERLGWHLAENSAPDSGGWEEFDIPCSWNLDRRFERYEGFFWYAVDFPLPAGGARRDIAIKFLAVNYSCRAWVNGSEIGTHEGGFLPFEFEIPGDILEADNRLVVQIDNLRSPRRVPGLVFDWFNYGGIVRDVELLSRCAHRFVSVQVSSKLMSRDRAAITIEYAQKCAFPFSWNILHDGKSVASGVAERAGGGNILIDLHAALPWSPESPELYRLELTPVHGEYADGYSTRFGIREITAVGAKIILNGKPLLLRGVSLHEELPPYGRTIPREQRFKDVADIKRLGFNALRTAHYAHDEALVDAADEAGLLVFEEIPVYWELDYSSPEVQATAESMLRDMISRDFNHPSVILWSVGNEVPVENPHCEALMLKLMSIARRLDPTRLVTYVSSRFLTDTTRRESDICCVNCYVGWYFGDEKHLAGLMEMTRDTAPDKPWIMTEFGACARRGFRSRTKEKYSEDRQAEFISHYIRTLNGMDWISGWFIWIYRDFRSPIRNHRYQSGFNRKGIVDEKNAPKLIAADMPSLIENKIQSGTSATSKIAAPALSMLETLAWRFAMPLVMKSQCSEYDRFYEKKNFVCKRTEPK